LRKNSLNLIDEKNFIQDRTNSSESKLAQLVKSSQSAGLKTKTLIRLGEPFSEIIKVAEEVDASLVVLGHRGHSLAEEILLGSTAEKVARKCKRPVLLIR